MFTRKKENLNRTSRVLYYNIAWSVVRVRSVLSKKGFTKYIIIVFDDGDGGAGRITRKNGTNEFYYNNIILLERYTRHDDRIGRPWTSRRTCATPRRAI